MITKEEIIEDVIAVKERMGKIPLRNEYLKYGKYSKSTIDRNFGCWSKLATSLFGKTAKAIRGGTFETTCTICDKKIIRNNSQRNSNDRYFCSHSCCVTYFNKIKPKRSYSKKCKTCDNKIPSNRTFCDKCYYITRYEKMENETIREANYGDGANKFTKIRSRARSILNKNNEPKICKNCGYDIHVECCHITDISQFDENTPLKIVNSLDNLIYLCNNCHWEFDNGYLCIDENKNFFKTRNEKSDI